AARVGGTDGAGGQRDDRGTAGQRLDRADAEVLLPGLHEERAGSIELPKALAGEPREELYGGTRECAEARLLRAAAHEHEPPPETPRGLDREVEPLVGDQRADAQQEVLARIAGAVEEAHVHRREGPRG